MEHDDPEDIGQTKPCKKFNVGDVKLKQVGNQTSGSRESDSASILQSSFMRPWAEISGKVNDYQ